MQFFAAACDPTCPSSTMPSLFVSIPSLPAAKQITQSGWLNTKSSISFELCVYGKPGVTSPQEFVCTRALSLNAGPNRSCRSSGIPPSPPLLSSSDCIISLAWSAVPWITPPMDDEFPLPSTEPQTWVPWPSGSSVLPGRPNGTTHHPSGEGGMDVGDRSQVEAGIGDRHEFALALEGRSVQHDAGIHDRPGLAVEQLDVGRLLDVTDLIDGGEVVQIALLHVQADLVSAHREIFRVDPRGGRDLLLQLGVVGVDIVMQHNEPCGGCA